VTLVFDVSPTASAGEKVISFHASTELVDANGKDINYTAVNGGITVVQFPRGDVNRSGSVTLADLTALRRHFANISGWVLDLSDPVNVFVADINANGSVTLADLTHFRRYFANIPGWDLVL
jgi:hypothetical protein